MKGRAAKTLVGTTWHYEIGFGVWQFHGEEGDYQGFEHYIPPSSARKVHQGHDLHIERVYHVQTDKYDYAKKDAEALAKSKKRPAAIPAAAETKSQKKEDVKVKLEDALTAKAEDTSRTFLGGIPLEDTECEAEEEKDSGTTQENASLRAKLAKAQEKIVVMASTIEQIHRSMEPLVVRLETAAKIMRTAAKEGTFSLAVN